MEDSAISSSIDENRIRLVIPPFMSRTLLLNTTKPMAQYLSRSPDFNVSIHVGNSLDGFTREVIEGRFELVYPSAFMASYLVKDHGFRPLLRTNESYHGVVFALERGPVSRIQDLRGKTIAMAGGVHGGSIMGIDMLLRAGLTVGEDIEIREVERYDTVILDVLGGKADAGAVPDNSLSMFSEPLLESLRIVAVSQLAASAVLLASPSSRYRSRHT